MERRTTFLFDEHGKKNWHSNNELIENVRRFVAANPSGPHRLCDFEAWKGRRCCPSTVAKRFGGWRRALWAAGHKSARRGNYSPQELIDILEEAWRKIERPPGHRTLRKVGRISGQLYDRHWGTLKNARDKLARFHRAEITRDQLLAPAFPGPRSRPPLRPSIRYKIFQRDHNRCQLCGRSPSTDPDTILEIDHIHPVAKGGTDTPKNLRTLCRQCNRGKAAA